MDKETKECVEKRGMIEIAPGIWTTSARTPAEDSADWTPYTKKEFQERMTMIKLVLAEDDERSKETT